MALKSIKGIVQCFNGNTSTWNNLETVIPKGILIFDIETRDLKLGDGISKYANLPVLMNLDNAYEKYTNTEGLDSFDLPEDEDIDKIIFINSNKKYSYGEITITDLINTFSGVDGINETNDNQNQRISDLTNKFIHILSSITVSDDGKLVTILGNQFAPSIVNIDDYIDSTSIEAASTVSLSIDDVKIYKEGTLENTTSFLIKNHTYYVKIFASDKLNNAINYSLSSSNDYFDINQVNDEIWTIKVNSLFSVDVESANLNVICTTQYALKSKSFNIDVVDPTKTLGPIDFRFYKDEELTDEVTNARLNESSTYYVKISRSDSYGFPSEYSLSVSDDSSNLPENSASNIINITNTNKENIFKVDIADVSNISKYTFTATVYNQYTSKSVNSLMTVLDISGAFTVTDIKFYATLDDALNSNNEITGNLRDYTTYYAKIIANDDNGFTISYALDWEYVDTGLPQDTADIQITQIQQEGNIFEINIDVVNTECEIKFNGECNNTVITRNISKNKIIKSSFETLSINSYNTKFYDNPNCTGTPLNYLFSDSTAYIKVDANDENGNAITSYTVSFEPNETRINPVSFPTNGQSNVGTMVLGTFDANEDNYKFGIQCETSYASANIDKYMTIISTSKCTSIDSIRFYHDDACTNEVDKNSNNEYMLIEDKTYYAKIDITDNYLDKSTFTYSIVPNSNESAFSISEYSKDNNGAIFEISINNILDQNTEVDLDVNVDNGYNVISSTISVELRDVESGLIDDGVYLYNENVTSLLWPTDEPDPAIFNDTSDNFAFVVQYEELNNLPVNFEISISQNTDNKITVINEGDGNNGTPYHFWVIHIDDLDIDRDYTLTVRVNNGYTEFTGSKNIRVYDLYGNLSFGTPQIKIFDDNDNEVTGNLYDNKSNVYYAQVYASDAHGATITYDLSSPDEGTLVSNISNVGNGKFTFDTLDITNNQTVTFVATIDNGGGSHVSDDFTKVIEDVESIIIINSIQFKKTDESPVPLNSNDNYPMLNENTTYYADIDVTVQPGHSVTNKTLTCNDTNVTCSLVSGDRFQVVMPSNYASNASLIFHVLYTSELNTNYNGYFNAHGIDVDGGLSINNVLIYKSGDTNKTPVTNLLNNANYVIEVTATDVNYPNGLQYNITLDGSPTGVTISTNDTNSSTRTLEIADLSDDGSCTINISVTNTEGAVKNTQITKNTIDVESHVNATFSIYTDSSLTNQVSYIADINSTYYLKIAVNDNYGTVTIDSVVSSNGKIIVGTITNEGNNVFTCPITLSSINSNNNDESVNFTVDAYDEYDSFNLVSQQFTYKNISNYVSIAPIEIYENFDGTDLSNKVTGSLEGNKTYYGLVQGTISDSSIDINDYGIDYDSNADPEITSITQTSSRNDVFEIVIGTVNADKSASITPKINVIDLTTNNTEDEFGSPTSISLVMSTAGLNISSIDIYPDDTFTSGDEIDSNLLDANTTYYVKVNGYDANNGPFEYSQSYGDNDYSDGLIEVNSSGTPIGAAALLASIEENTPGANDGKYKIVTKDLTNGDKNLHLKGYICNSSGYKSLIRNITIWDMDYNFPTPVLSIHKLSDCSDPKITGNLKDNANGSGIGFYYLDARINGPHGSEITYTLSISGSGSSYVTAPDGYTNNSGIFKIAIDDITSNTSVTFTVNCSNNYNGSSSGTLNKTIIDTLDGLSIDSVEIYTNSNYSNLFATVNDLSRIRIKENTNYYLKINVNDTNNLFIKEKEPPENNPSVFNITANGTTNSSVVDKNKYIINSSDLSNDTDTSIIFKYTNDNGVTYKSFTLNLTVVDLDQGLNISEIRIHKSNETGKIVDASSDWKLYDCWDKYVIEIIASDANSDLTGGITSYSYTSSHPSAYTENSINNNKITIIPNNLTSNISNFTITATVTNGIGKHASLTSHTYTFVDEDGALNISAIRLYETDSSNNKTGSPLTLTSDGSGNYYQLTDKRINDNNVNNKYVIEVDINENNGNDVTVELVETSSALYCNSTSKTVSNGSGTASFVLVCNDIGSDSGILNINIKAIPQLSHTITKVETIPIKIINTANAITVTSLNFYDASDNSVVDVSNTPLLSGENYYAIITINDPHGFGIDHFTLTCGSSNISINSTGIYNKFNIDLSGVPNDLSNVNFQVDFVNSFGENKTNAYSKVVNNIYDVLHSITIGTSDYYDDDSFASSSLSSTIEGTTRLLAGKTYYIRVNASDNHVSITNCTLSLSGSAASKVTINSGYTQPNIFTFKLDLDSSIATDDILQVEVNVSNGYYTKSEVIIDDRAVDNPADILTISGYGYYDDIDGNPITHPFLADTDKLPASSNNNHCYYAKIDASSGHNLSINYQFFPNLNNPKITITQVGTNGAPTSDTTSPWFTIQIDRDFTNGSPAAGISSSDGGICSNFPGVSKKIYTSLACYDALENIDINNIDFSLNSSPINYLIENTTGFSAVINYTINNSVDSYGLIINSYELTENANFINYSPTNKTTNRWDFDVGNLAGTDYYVYVTFTAILHTNYGDKSFTNSYVKVYNASEDLNITNIKFYETFNNGILSDEVTSNPPALIEGKTYYAEVIADYYDSELTINYDNITVSDGSLIEGGSTITDKPDSANYPNIFRFTIASFTASSGYYNDCIFTAHCKVTK